MFVQMTIGPREGACLRKNNYFRQQLFTRSSRGKLKTQYTMQEVRALIAIVLCWCIVQILVVGEIGMVFFMVYDVFVRFPST
jgi:hypothetical protein